MPYGGEEFGAFVGIARKVGAEAAIIIYALDYEDAEYQNHLDMDEYAVAYGEEPPTYEHARTEDGYILWTREMLEEATTLSGYIQHKAVKKLVEAGMVEVKFLGLPRKRYIRQVKVK